ncbi:MAG: glycosyltransferase [Bacteriovoracia bacterium]
MKVTFHYPRVLPALKYGGTERILVWTMRELVRQGHEVTFIGPAGSDLSRDGVRFVKDATGEWWTRLPKGVDVVHLTYPPPRDLGVPTLATIHGNGRTGEVFPPNVVFLSRKHAENHGAECFVYNGVDFSEYPFHPRPGTGWERFLFLAKASWKVKNLRDCVRAARASRKRLDIAGGRAWIWSRYVKSHGQVDQVGKNRLLQNAHALLNPVRWHEPFGISMVEAFATGLPVIGSRYGSLPELVDDENGILCDRFADFSRALLEPPKAFDPECIRARAEARFSSAVMVESYLKLYAKVIAGEPLNSRAPSWRLNQPAEQLLDF